MTDSTAPSLVVEDLHAHYGESHVLHGVNFHVKRGEVVTLLGRNGAGKTSTMRSIIGLLRKRSGSIRYEGVETVTLPPHEVARLGIGYCPEERGIFSSLTVQENLVLPPIVKQGAMRTDEVLQLFPRLAERRSSQGTKLSGGEQQMLAIARILRTGAKFLLLDEPTEGLAPVIVQHIGEIIRKLKASGFTVLLVEQNFHFASTIADRHYVIEGGRIVDMLPNEGISENAERLERLLGV